MVQIVKITFNDDKYASINVDIMICSSIDLAKEIVLKVINKNFDGEWKSLSDAAEELDGELTMCRCEENSFEWYDNGKGENYYIASLNAKEVNTTFQRVL